MLRQLFDDGSAQEYIGEPVSQVEHALQAAHIASEQGAASDVILAALLHDVGHLVFPEAEAMADVGVLDHERLGATWLESLGFSASVTRLVASHVDAKRYLVSTDPQYRERLSAASARTLEFQGGPITAPEAAESRSRY